MNAAASAARTHQSIIHPQFGNQQESFDDCLFLPFLLIIAQIFWWCMIFLRTPDPVASSTPEFDLGRRAALVGRLAIGADGFRQLSIGGVGTAEFIKRAT